MEPIKKIIESYQLNSSPRSQGGANRQEPEYEQAFTRPADFSDKQTTYCTVYNGLTPRFDLTPIEILVLAMTIGLSRKNKPCIASQLTFASTFNVSDPTAQEALKRLEKKGVIERTGRLSRYRTHELVLTKQASDYLRNLRAQIKLKKIHNEEERNRSKDSLDNNY